MRMRSAAKPSQLSPCTERVYDLDSLICEAQQYYQLGTVFRLQSGGKMGDRIGRAGLGLVDNGLYLICS